jgi:mono/diheme cytochrome c family protein
MTTVVMIAACGKGETPADRVPGRWYTESQVAAGEPLYQANCAACHGADGSATADWRRTDANGNFPPPPLDGSAHTWHHPLEVLTDTIANGGGQYGGLMPAFGGIIDESGRLAIVAYIQSWWSDAIYERWAEINAR